MIYVREYENSPENESEEGWAAYGAPNSFAERSKREE